jgi:chemotaxis protein CheZ
MKQYIGFRLGESEYTIPILKVREIINTPNITTLPQSPHYMKGIVNLRGKIIPVVDLKELISVGGQKGVGSKTIVISSGRATFGVLVDSITSVVNIEKSEIEAPEGFMHENLDRVEGVARLDDRLVILLDTDKLVEAEGMGMFDEGLLEIEGSEMKGVMTEEPALAIESGEAKKHESVKPAIEGGNANKGLKEVKEELKEKFKGSEQRELIVDSIVKLMNMLASRDYDSAEVVLDELMQNAEKGLYIELGTVTRKLHDSIRDFKKTLDPRIKQIANEEVPQAVDSLEFVLAKTEDAANRTVGIVEKYLAELPEYDRQLKRFKSPKAAIEHLKSFRKSFGKYLGEVMVAQQYQDITGQAIRKVISLVNDIETELVGLITSFGVKMDLAPEREEKPPEKITQDDVEDLLKEFGF